MSQDIVDAMSDPKNNLSFFRTRGSSGGGRSGGASGRNQVVNRTVRSGGARFDADGNGGFDFRDFAIHGVWAAAAAGGGLVGTGAGTVVGGPVGGFVGGAALGAACYDAHSR